MPLRTYETGPDLCRRLGITRQKLSALVVEGMPVHRLGHRTLRYDPAAVDAWLDDRRERQS